MTESDSPDLGASVRDIFATMPARLRPEAAAGVDALFAYDITGEGGGRFLVRVREGKATVEEASGELTGYGVKMTMEAATFVGINLGKVDGAQAFASGKVKLDGELMLAAGSARLFKRYVQQEPTKTVEELIRLPRNIAVGMRYATGPVMGRFLDGLKEKKILANVCPRCRRKQIPPREVCAECRVRATEFIEVGPLGTLVHVEVVYYASPDPLTGETRETPYGDVRVLLDGCHGRETFWHLLKREDLFRVSRGSRVRPVWAEERTGTIHDIRYFEKE